MLRVSVFLSAQTAGTGALTGTVSDPTGAAVPNATIQVTNSETGQKRTVTTGADGAYSVPLLPPGTYKVEFSANGFKRVEVAGVKVNVTERPVLDQALQVGAQTEQVTVEATAETVQTANSTLGTVVAATMATSLPLNTRNYTNLLGLSAGANASVNNASALGKGAMEIATNGASTGQNNFQMDGASITGYASNGTIGQGAYATFGIPNPDTLAEFKIQTSAYDAGYGRNPGANVNVVTKSGTNAFHGTGFEFFRNTALNANDFFRNRTCGANPTLCTSGVKQVLNQNQFGGTVGGPIKKDKLFFFISEQETRQKNGAASQGSAGGITLFPIPADRSNPTALRQALGQVFSNIPTSVGGAQVAPDGSNINPVAIAYLQAKNADGSYFIPGNTSSSSALSGITFTKPARDTEHQGMANLDYNISAKHTLSSRYFLSRENQYIPFACPNCVPGTDSTNQYNYYNGVLKLTSVLTPTVVNEARMSVQRSLNEADKQSAVTNSIVGVTPLGAAVDFAPIVVVNGAFQAGAGITNLSKMYPTQYQWADQVSMTKGKHTIRVGGEFGAYQWNWALRALSQGVLRFQNFSDFLIGLPGNCGPAVAGVCNGAALSNIQSTAQFSVRSGAGGIVHAYRAHDINWFVQDDYKVSSRLTVNLGLRWEYFGLPSDKYGNATTLWRSKILSVPVPGSSAAQGTYAGWVVPANYDTKTWGPAPQGVFVNSNNIPTESAAKKNNFAPRMGFAWQPLNTNRFVVRGGAGFYYDRVSGGLTAQTVQQSAPYAITLDQAGAANSFASLANPFQSTPLGSFPVRWVNFTNSTGSNIGQPLIAETVLTPIIYSYNLNFQYEFLPKWVLEAGYVGSRGIHQWNPRQPVNEAALATATAPVNGVTTNTAANALLRVPYLGFNSPNFLLASSSGDYKYNSLQVTLRKQMSHGLTLQAAYTFSRAFSTLTGPNLSSTNGDPINSRQQYGLNPSYRPQRLVVNYSWDIPSAKMGGMIGKLTSGWNLSGVTTIQGGQPLSITDNRGGAVYGMSAATNVLSRAQIAPGKTYADITTSGGLTDRLGGLSGGCGYFQCGANSAFTTIPVIGQVNGVGGATGWGNTGVGIFLGPGQFNFDLSAIKNTRVGGLSENALLQFRAEFFNIFNHAQFNNPETNSALGAFGQIGSTSVNPRLIQLALKYIF